MKLSPTAKCDQNDNERPAKVSTKNKKGAGKWFRQHGHEADQKGCSEAVTVAETALIAFTTTPL
jgi:hypothetical protein